MENNKKEKQTLFHRVLRKLEKDKEAELEQRKRMESY